MVNRVKQGVAAKWSDMAFTSSQVPGGTGCLEVTITKADGKSKLVHSKLGGDGKVTRANVAGVLAKIKAFLDA